MPTNPGDRARAQLLELERRRQLAVVSEFEKIKGRLASDLADLLERIEKERLIDGNASPGSLIQKARLNEMLDAVTDEIRKSSQKLAGLTTTAQNRAVDIAKDQAGQYPDLKADLNFFDSDAAREAIGIAGDGEALAVHFAKLVRPARQAMFDALFYGIATGKPNVQIAREVQDAIGGTRAQAMTIVRTETNRAYREATRKFYDDVEAVKGWRWVAALDLTTCPICWALHGRIFKTKTKFGTHPNCRCTLVPVFDDDPPVESGPKIFARLTEAQQRTILGPGRLELYKQGAELSDFVENRKSAFGIGRAIKPLERTTFKPKPRTLTTKPALPPAEPARTFATKKEADEWLGVTAFDQWSRNLSREEAYAVSHYGTTAYDDLNRKLRGFGPTNEYYSDAELEKITADLDACIGRGVIPEPVKVFRGFGLPYPQTLEVGQVFQDRGFVSASLRPEVAQQFAGYALDNGNNPMILEFDVPAGTNAGTTWRFLEKESELIFPRDSEFTITEVQERDGVTYAKARYKR